MVRLLRRKRHGRARLGNIAKAKERCGDGQNQGRRAAARERKRPAGQRRPTPRRPEEKPGPRRTILKDPHMVDTAGPLRPTRGPACVAPVRLKRSSSTPIPPPSVAYCSIASLMQANVPRRNDPPRPVSPYCTTCALLSPVAYFVRTSYTTFQSASGSVTRTQKSSWGHRSFNGRLSSFWPVRAADKGYSAGAMPVPSANRPSSMMPPRLDSPR